MNLATMVSASIHIARAIRIAAMRWTWTSFLVFNLVHYSASSACVTVRVITAR
jgi:hypothetical protein